MNFVLEFDKDVVSDIIEYISANSSEEKSVPSGTLFKINGTNISIYTSGKVLFQGKDAKIWYEKLSNIFIPKKNIIENKKITQKDLSEITTFPRIGSDESGKGDFFGPLVTAAFMLVSKEVENELISLGVTDSKKIKDNKIFELAPIIKNLGPSQIIKINPIKYNELYKKMNNINKILGWSHARAIENILIGKECKLAIADQFGDEKIIKSSLFKLGKDIELIQTPKAERDLAVAAASILAREAFLKGINSLSEKYRTVLPLGAGENVISTGVQHAKKNGISSLTEISKTHFRTLDNIMSKL